MALNQTQRDHAIKMIETAINEKKKSISVPTLSKKEFIEAKFMMDSRFSLKQIMSVTEEKYYSATVDILALLDAKESYEQHCTDVRQQNTLLTAGLTALEFDLKGEVMFGNDYSVISAALEKIASFE